MCFQRHFLIPRFLLSPVMGDISLSVRIYSCILVLTITSCLEAFVSEHFNMTVVFRACLGANVFQERTDFCSKEIKKVGLVNPSKFGNLMTSTVGSAKPNMECRPLCIMVNF